MDCYPKWFPVEAKDHIEIEKIMAARERDLIRSESAFPDCWPAMKAYLLRIFLVFAQEATAQAPAEVSLNRIDMICKEFLRQLALETISLHRFQFGSRVKMFSDVDGSIIPEVRREFETTPEWRKYEDMLIASATVVPAPRPLAHGMETAFNPAQQRPESWRTKMPIDTPTAVRRSGRPPRENINGDLVKKVRGGLKQEAFAAQCCISVDTLQTAENQNKATADIISKIAASYQAKAMKLKTKDFKQIVPSKPQE